MLIGVDEHLHGGSTSGASGEWVLLVPFLLAADVYLAAVASGIRQGHTWPWRAPWCGCSA